MDTYEAVAIAEGFQPEDDPERIREAWQTLVDTGLCWKLQDWFGRMAATLIAAGEIEARAA